MNVLYNFSGYLQSQNQLNSLMYCTTYSDVQLLHQGLLFLNSVWFIYLCNAHKHEKVLIMEYLS